MGKVEDAVATMTRNLESNTGRSLEAWAKLVRARKLGRLVEERARTRPWLRKPGGLHVT